jgi:phage terminase large subunit
MKGVSDVDIAVIEEAEDIRDKTKYDTFSDSIRKEGSLIIIILNTPDIEHWIVQRYFDTVEPDIQVDDPKLIDGYFKLIPKKIPGFVCIQTSYLDNVNPKTGINNLPKGKITEYEGYGDPSHHLYDWHHYMTDIKGYASTGRKGQVLTKCKPISLEEYLAVDAQEIIGQDFGTSSPAATVGVKIVGNTVYAREINYEPLDNLEIGKMYCRLEIGDNDIIIADSAEPGSITKLRTGWQDEELVQSDKELYPQLLKGWNIYGMIKGPGSIEAGISNLKTYTIYIYGANFWVEIRNYIYAQDKFGNYTNKPIDAFNHLIDMLRGVVAGKGRFF